MNEELYELLETEFLKYRIDEEVEDVLLTLAESVRAISRMRSIPIIRAIPSMGSPTELKTMDRVIRPTPGTPAVPMEASVAVAITVT